MELRARTCQELAQLMISGLISREEWAGFLDGLHEPPAPVEHLTLGEFGELSEAGDDISTVQTYRRLLGLRPLSESDSAKEFVRELAAIRAGVRMVDSAFSRIPRPSLSALEKSAGYGAADNFGLFGLVDCLARRQGLTDEQAKAITVANAIGKLTIDAEAARRERRLIELQNQRARRGR